MFFGSSVCPLKMCRPINCNEDFNTMMYCSLLDDNINLVIG